MYPSSVGWLAQLAVWQAFSVAREVQSVLPLVRCANSLCLQVRQEYSHEIERYSLPSRVSGVWLNEVSWQAVSVARKVQSVFSSHTVCSC